MTKLSRRGFMHFAAAAAGLPTIATAAWEQTYPSRPVRMIVGWPAGGAVDIIARLMAQSLSERLGQQFIVENRPGAGGNIATGAVVRAAADGYTLLQITMADAINVTLYEKLNFNFSRDIAPIASVCRGSGVMVVNASFPAKTIAEFIVHAKANPGKISMASAGAGTPAHLTGELFKIMTGIDMLHVPFRGSAAALTNLLGGEVEVVFADLPSSIEYIKAGKLRPLAITSAARLEALPDVPTLTEFLPGCEASAWHGIGAPKGTPTAVIETLCQAINAGLADPRLRTRIADVGYEAYASSSSEFSKLIADETDKWGKLIRAANIKPE
jgi:tripartite-type tricarboxylate transporter receptor subunit TctC